MSSFVDKNAYRKYQIDYADDPGRFHSMPGHGKKRLGIDKWIQWKKRKSQPRQPKTTLNGMRMGE